jgi:hypothetical protein
MSLNVRLAGRLAQFFGTLAALISNWLLSSIWVPGPPAVSLFGSPIQDFAIVYSFALCFGIPFYFLALLILQVEIVSVLKRPLFWCVGIPGILLAIGLVVFPPARVGGIFWIALIPLSALFAGAMFYAWLQRKPLTSI